VEVVYTGEEVEGVLTSRDKTHVVDIRQAGDALVHHEHARLFSGVHVLCEGEWEWEWEWGGRRWREGEAELGAEEVSGVGWV
jgi:hypothetical protein